MIPPKQVALLSALCLFLSFTPEPAAQDPCALLTDAETKRVNAVLSAEHCYDCCDRTIAECLKQRPRCRLATRLKRFVCRLVRRAMTCQQIERALLDRGLSMMETASRAAIDPGTGSRVGEPEAPVKAALYICVRCPFCSSLFPQLHDTVVKGKLKGKAQLLVKAFPIKGHPYSVEGGLAAIAAWKQGKMAAFFLEAYRHFDSFEVEHLPLWAEGAGLDMEAYRRAIGKAATRDLLVAVKREGYANRVDATPTLFVNGRKYQGPMDLETLVDVMSEEYDRMRGDVYEPPPSPQTPSGEVGVSDLSGEGGE